MMYREGEMIVDFNRVNGGYFIRQLIERGIGEIQEGKFVFSGLIKITEDSAVGRVEDSEGVLYFAFPLEITMSSFIPQHIQNREFIAAYEREFGTMRRFTELDEEQP